MALTYGFYNSVEGDRTYDAIQMGQIFDGIITDGVYATFLKAMVVKASDNPSEVIVQPGRCWFNHTWTYIDADYPVTAPAPEVILDRVDALVIDINTENAFRENSLVWVQGTPSSINPERPTLIKSVTHNQYPLCYVYRKAGTTMIYAADITNAVGTSETPFVTGVLTGINIDDLLAQWDDEFHTWETTTKTSFEAWMVNQQSVYVTWFDSIKDQMEDDLAGFEAWFETIRGIIDEEAATHLQAEIDDILDMLPAGSHIDISTNEPTLFNRNVTVSDGVHSKTVQFNAIGGATVESFPYIGIISVTSTDGERIASESLNIPYFGRYSATLAFWSATVSLLGDETLAGLAVTVRDGNGDVVSVVTLNGSGQGVFTATGPDTYKFIYTYGGQTMEVSLAVTQETTYEVEIHGGFNFSQWLTAGRVSESFSSLDEILEDEPTLRQLMLVHDSVDYICNTFTAGSLADVTKIFNTDLAAKWINLSDYALDHFYAVPEIKSIMDTADKYGYGEWVITDSTTTPPTWGPKGNVPVMTANTAPYGVTSASNVSSGYEAYKAFNEDYSTYWVSGQTTVPRWIQYQFTSPVCVRKFKVHFNTNPTSTTYVVQGSNDGSTFTDISDSITDTSRFNEHNIDNENYYLYYRINITAQTTSGTIGQINILQFYGRELKVSVPVMTSNTAPYGVAIASTEHSSYKAYGAFDNSSSSYWFATDMTNAWVGYDFGRSVNVKFVYVEHQTNRARIGKYKIQGSNDGITWIDESDVITANVGTSSVNGKDYDVISVGNGYKYHRLLCTERGSSYEVGLAELQFYGLDYSEKEFEAGTTKKWLYDHGVELEELDYTSFKASASTLENDGTQLVLSGGYSANQGRDLQTNQKIDATDYSLVMARLGNRFILSAGNVDGMEVASNKVTSYNDMGNYRLSNTNISLPTNDLIKSINISSINQEVIFGIGSRSTGTNTLTTTTISEWWLE